MRTARQEADLAQPGAAADPRASGFTREPEVEPVPGSGTGATDDQAPGAEQVSSGPSSLADALNLLDQQDLPALQTRWQEVYGREAPKRFGAEFLKRALAWRLQEQALGGLSRHAQLRLNAWGGGRQSGASSASVLPAQASIKPGTRFVREWQGVTHEVLALEGDAFVYRNKTYRSLTEVAKVITGTHQSGPRFFGIGKYAPRRNQGRDEKHLEQPQGPSTIKRRSVGGFGDG